MNIVRLIEQILPETTIEQEFWESEHSQKDTFCQGIEMWRTEVVYLSALNRCLHEIGNDDTEELQIHECHHLLWALYSPPVLRAATSPSPRTCLEPGG
jgi:hypothetical protein